MLYCCIAIDYLSQLERSGVREVGAFVEDLRSIASAFGGTIANRKNPLVLGYPLTGSFDGLQVVEALRRSVASTARHKAFLRGVVISAHQAEAAEEALAFNTMIRYRDSAAFACVLSTEAKSALSAYFAFGDTDGSWIEPEFAHVLADANAGRLFERPRLAETMARAIAKAERDGPRLVHLEAGHRARSTGALTAAAGLTQDRFLVLSGIKTRPLPFSPLLETIAAARDSTTSQDTVQAGSTRSGYTETGESSPDITATVQSDYAAESAFDFVLASSFAEGAPDSVSRGCASYIGRWLDGFGDRGGVVVCDAPERFSAEALSLIADRLSSGRGTERYLSLSDDTVPEAWTGSWAARVPVELAGADDWPSSVEAALGSTTGAIRETLKTRFSAISGESGSSGTAQALKLLPTEAALYLYGIHLSDQVLSEAEFSEYMLGFGLKPEGEALIRSVLARVGLIAPYDSHGPLEPLDAPAIIKIIGQSVAAEMERGFSEFLKRLYRSGRIRPSLGFLHRVGEQPDEERIVYECLFEDVLRPDNPRVVDPGFLSASSACVYRFWSALMAADRPSSEAAAAAAEERVAGPRSLAVKALVRAELAYATGDADRASKGSREALLALGRGAPPKLEARSQRMMGLASLALGKHTEAADYLTNAQEMAETAGDEYERMMAAYAKALVEFLVGALGRAVKAAACAAESASRLFRIDMALGIEALRGRIDLELGAYDEAARRFSLLAEQATRYGIHQATQRASIWRSRALAYAGEFDTAASDLEAEASDDEARVFRGELDILRGRPRDARIWLDAPADPLVRPFGPPDSFEWSSLFSEIEGRSIGFDSADAPLAELRTALALFAQGLDERNPDCAVELHALTRAERASRINPGMGTYSFFCYLLEERLSEPPVDKQTVLSRAFKILQQRAGRIEDRAQRALYMEKNAWNKRLLEAARTHKFI
ncbi:MAG: hypothetical protein JXM71_08900 [Spirochaetales bacterium]|nr:hypothetical protein [Spirochaetales bacterium]